MGNAYNLKAIKDDFKAKGIFYTPPELADLIKSFVDIPVKNVYDPTCGDGALLSCFSDDVVKYGQEINDHQLAVAMERIPSLNGYCGDTLSDPAFMDMKFDCIVANPPFSIAWSPDNVPLFDPRFSQCPYKAPKSKADYAFILHILHLLDENGIAVVMGFPGILYRSNAEGKIRQWLIENNYIDKVVRIGGDRFVDTKIETCVLVLRKNKKNTDITFIDTVLEKELKVSFERVSSNGFNLSVSSYIFEERFVEKVDPIALQRSARLGFIRQLKKDLDFDRKVCELEGWDFQQYLDEIQSILNSYR